MYYRTCFFYNGPSCKWRIAIKDSFHDPLYFMDVHNNQGLAFSIGQAIYSAQRMDDAQLRTYTFGCYTQRVEMADHCIISFAAIGYVHDRGLDGLCAQPIICRMADQDEKDKKVK